MILAASVFVFGYAVWGLLILVTSPAGSGTIYDDHGLLGLVVSMLPATILLIAGLSMFALTKWAILATALNLLVLSSSFPVEGAWNVTTIVWALASLAVVIYAIWLRRKGILT